jgi:hypothetical protein
MKGNAQRRKASLQINQAEMQITARRRAWCCRASTYNIMHIHRLNGLALRFGLFQASGEGTVVSQTKITAEPEQAHPILGFCATRWQLSLSE